MHILLVLHDFALGGAERIALRLAGAWTEQGHRITLASGSVEGPLRALVHRGIDLRIAAPEISRGSTRWPLGRFVARLCREVQPDILFLPGNYYFEIAAAVKLARGRSPVIVGKMSNAVVRRAERRPKAAKRIATLWLKARFPDHIVATSAAGLAEARAWLGGRASRFTTIAQPVLEGSIDLDEHPLARTLIAAGRLEPQKNFSLLLRALAQLPSSVDLTIVGEGRLRDRLMREALDLGIAGRVRFPGYADGIAPFLLTSRLFVLSSDYEGFPSVLVEALACGLPVVATDCAPSMRELIDDETAGRVVPVGDTVALARAIHDVLDRPPSPRADVAARAAPYRLETSASSYLDLFRRLDEQRHHIEKR
jgi:glycosyltransferase involved in cell wall biosynthesis